MKKCFKCGKFKNLDEFYKHKQMADGYLGKCKKCTKHDASAHRKANIEAVRAYDRTRTKLPHRRSYQLRKFGITSIEYDEILKRQNNVCAICNKISESGRRLAVDHDHDSGMVRGLLCGKCNRGIGLFDDNPETLEKAISYLGVPRVSQGN